jgi:hypothetical protein
MRKAENLLNYRTEVAVGKTVAEIVALLVGKNVASINTGYKDGKVEAVTFVVKIAEAMVPFRLTPNVAGVAKRPEVRSQGMAQAERVAWRIVLRWVEAQMAMVESNQAEIGQIFMPYAVDNNGETLWNAFQMSHTKGIYIHESLEGR